jgi:hypothetical protein
VANALRGGGQFSMHTVYILTVHLLVVSLFQLLALSQVKITLVTHNLSTPTFVVTKMLTPPQTGGSEDINAVNKLIG